MKQYDNEIPKYLKQKESNVSKSNKKPKHKHNYEECLIQYNSNIRKEYVFTVLSSYCTICGKIDGKFKENKSIVKDYKCAVDTPIGKCYKMISCKELYEKYHDRLPVFFIEDIFKDGYVNFEENEK